jgi:hypothetical protein
MSQSTKTPNPALLKLAYQAPNDVKINHCLIRNGYPTEVFISSLNNEEKASLVALFRLFGEKRGKIENGQKFKKLEDYFVAILEFKDKQVRLAGFWREKYNFNLIYGFVKKQDTWPRKDLNAMRGNYDDFIAEEKRRSAFAMSTAKKKGGK